MISTCNSQKILHIYYEPFFSGISRHVLYSLKAINNDKYDSMVLCSTGDDRIQTALKINLGEDRVTIVGPGRFFSFSGFYQTVRLIRTHKVEIVHIHNLQTGTWAIPAAILAGCRNLIFTPHVDNVGIGFLKPVARKLIRLARFIPLTFIAVSREQKKRILDLGIAQPGKVKYIPNHISKYELDEILHLNPGTIRSKNDLPQDAIVVSQVARLDRQKDPHFLIRVAQLTRSQVPHMIFLLIGDGPLKNELAQQINSLELNAFVRLMGYRDDARELMHASDMATLTSRWEGLPYALLEAVYFKKPAVVTDIPGNREVIVDCESGYLANTPEQFAARLVELAQKKELRIAMGEAGHLRNKDLFDFNHQASQMGAVYVQIKCEE
ncbi:MAG: glycosyltransferase [Proteobacteria bacterium]|nr:glycosyltransferase [Pseudomonadota bacterium]